MGCLISLELRNAFVLKAKILPGRWLAENRDRAFEYSEQLEGNQPRKFTFPQQNIC